MPRTTFPIRDPHRILGNSAMTQVLAWVEQEPRPAGMIVRVGSEMIVGRKRKLVAILWEPEGVVLWSCAVAFNRTFPITAGLDHCWSRFKEYRKEVAVA